MRGSDSTSSLLFLRSTVPSRRFHHTQTCQTGNDRLEGCKAPQNALLGKANKHRSDKVCFLHCCFDDSRRVVRYPPKANGHSPVLAQGFPLRRG
ncbi:hypothetical protein CCUS01_11407 [Colletotrichum cuscutae]|uniref:Uncharacterized protein n=1 Tax=Colletotrichum cuscutae TaxID=1209917 RepID=A0AAI9U5N3_9PEZI|nr:hypothetical protein CCUS01_11407 [Colletotrichum cuscutae]